MPLVLALQRHLPLLQLSLPFEAETLSEAKEGQIHNSLKMEGRYQDEERQKELKVLEAQFLDA